MNVEDDLSPNSDVAGGRKGGGWLITEEAKIERYAPYIIALVVLVMLCGTVLYGVNKIANAMSKEPIRETVIEKIEVEKPVVVRVPEIQIVEVPAFNEEQLFAAVRRVMTEEQNRITEAELVKAEMLEEATAMAIGDDVPVSSVKRDTEVAKKKFSFFGLFKK